MPDTTDLFAWQHKYYCNATINFASICFSKEKGRRNPAALGQEMVVGLFRGHLLRWVERAGIVDFLHLVVGEAEHLAQDLVGVLAEQR